MGSGDEEDPADAADEEAETANEEAESDPITEASLVAAEDLRDVAAEAEEEESNFEGTHYGLDEIEEKRKQAENVKVVVNDDGELFLQAKGASSLAASALTLLAVTSIIY